MNLRRSGYTETDPESDFSQLRVTRNLSFRHWRDDIEEFGQPLGESLSHEGSRKAIGQHTINRDLPWNSSSATNIVDDSYTRQPGGEIIPMRPMCL